MKEQFEKAREHSRDIQESLSKYRTYDAWLHDALDAYKKEAEAFRNMAGTEEWHDYGNMSEKFSWEE